MMMLRSIDGGNAAALASMQQRLVAFYDSTPHYYDCSSESDKSHFLLPILNLARGLCARKGHVRILEVGAGKSQAPAFFQDGLAEMSYSFDLQDINDRNAPFYYGQDVIFHVGSIDAIPAEKKYDLIFSMFVYEHLCEPAKALDAARDRLAEDGVIVLISPEYVLPFYVPPALRHLSAWKKFKATAALFLSSVRTRATGIPNFWVCSEPAVFHGPWCRDADAVHMVSKADLIAYFGDQFYFDDLDVKFSRGLRSFIGSRCLLRVVATRKS